MECKDVADVRSLKRAASRSPPVPSSKRNRLDGQGTVTCRTASNEPIDASSGGFRIIWDPSTETLDAFLIRVPPSLPQPCSWIQVHDPRCLQTKGSPSRICDPLEYSSLLQSLLETNQTQQTRDSALAQLLSIATRAGYTSGKWMLFPSGAIVNQAWGKVASAVVAGKLGNSAKVSPKAMDKDSHLICIYCADFNDKQNLTRVLLQLERMGLHVHTGFKPDVFTSLGIYSGNRYGLPVVLFKELLKEVRQ